MKLLVLFAVLLVGNVEGKILRVFPANQEVVYSYNAIVTTGTQNPAPVVSQFNLTGTIKVQSLQSHASVQLLDLQYSMYSGNARSQHNTTMVDLPLEASSLSQPFAIHYTDGKVSKLVLSFGEPTWSNSVKQALAGLLQLDLQNINISQHNSFTTKEQSIHGECLESYTVQPQPDGTQITKLHTGTDCQQSEPVWSNVDTDNLCPGIKSQDHDLISSSHKLYTVVQNDEESLLIKEVVSVGRTYTLATKSSNNKHSITVTQKFTLQSINEVKQFVEVRNAEEISTLHFDATEFHSFKFSTNEDLSGVVKKVLHFLSLIVSQLQGPNQLAPEEPNPQQAHLIPLLITYLRKLDVKLLEVVFSELKSRSPPSTSMMDIFIKILPLVGSRDSSLFVMDLISKNLVGDHVALSLLSSLPFNVRQTSEGFLHELENLLELSEDVSDSVRNAALLSFATLIYKTCKFNKCEKETVDKYALQYLQHVKDNGGNYAKQQVYMAGLQNIKSEKLVEYLKPIISEEVDLGNENLRGAALRAVFPVIASNPDMIHKVYWPVLSKRNNSLQLRVSALIFLSRAEPPASTLLRLHWFMAGERCSHLYNLYYTLLTSYASETNSACHFERSEVARRILSISRKPNLSTFSAHFEFDITEKEMVRISTVGNPETGSVESAYISFISNATGHPVDYYSIYIKAAGIKERLVKLLTKTTTFPSDMEAILSKESKDPLDVELVVYSNGQAVAARYYHGEDVGELFKDIRSLFRLKEDKKFSFPHVSSSFNLEKFFVTDLGMPGVLSADFPSLSNLKGDITQGASSRALTINSSIDIRFWSQGSTVLKVKNTIVNIWQGIIKTHISRCHLALSLHLGYNNSEGLQITALSNSGTTVYPYNSLQQGCSETNLQECLYELDKLQGGVIYTHLRIPQNLDFTEDSEAGRVAINRPEEVQNKSFTSQWLHVADDDKMGFKWHTKSDIFTITYQDDFDALSSSCPHCKSLTTITNSKAEKQTLRELRSDGYTFSSEVFDCEDDGSTNHIESAENVYSKNVFFPFGILLSGGHFLENLLLKQPIIRSCGLAALFYPNKLNTVSQVLVDLKLGLLPNGKDLYNGKNDTIKRNFVFSYGSVFPGRDCNLNVFGSIVVEEKLKEVPSILESEGVCHLDKCDLEESEGVCHLDKCDLGDTIEWEGLKPKVLTFSQVKDELLPNKITKISITFEKVPVGVQAAVNSLIAFFKIPSIKSDGIQNKSPQGELEFNVILLKIENYYSVDLILRYAHLVFKESFLNVHADIFNFLIFVTSNLCRF